MGKNHPNLFSSSPIMNTLNPLFQKRYCGFNDNVLKTNMKCFACILEKGWLQLWKASAWQHQSTPLPYCCSIFLHHVPELPPRSTHSFPTDPELHTYVQSDKSPTKIHKLHERELSTLLSWRQLHCGCFGGRKPTCWSPRPSADISVKAKQAFWEKSNANRRRKWFTPNS